MLSRHLGKRLALALAATALACCSVAWAAPRVQAQPCSPPATIDGHIDPLIQYAQCLTGQAGCGLDVPTPTGDVCKTNSLIKPCDAEVACANGGGTYFLNGFDMTRAVLAYDRPGHTLYLGFRVAGQIGDSDGDGSDGPGTPGVNGCSPNKNILDPVGINSQFELYRWFLDTNCDGLPDIIITPDGTAANLNVKITDGGGNPIPGAVGTGTYVGSDLEVNRL